MKNQKGFTLIELLVVIAVLGILVLLAGPKLLGYVQKAEVAHITHDVKVSENALATYLSDDKNKLEDFDLSNIPVNSEVYDKKGLYTESIGGDLYDVTENIESNLEGNFIANEAGKVYYVQDSKTDGETDSDKDTSTWTPKPAWSGNVPEDVTSAADSYVVRAVSLDSMKDSTKDTEEINKAASDIENKWKNLPDNEFSEFSSLMTPATPLATRGNGYMEFTVSYLDYLTTYFESELTNISTSLYGSRGGARFSDIHNGIIYDFANTRESMMFSYEVGGPGEIWGQSQRRVEVYTDYIQACGATTGCAGFEANIPNPTAFIAKLQTVRSMTELAKLWNSVSLGWGMVPEINDPVYTTIYEKVSQQSSETLAKIKEKGIVVPVDYVVPMTTDSHPLTYANGVYLDMEGEAYSGELNWLFPEPKIRNGDSTIPAGVYVDTPVLTGNSTYDKTILNNKSIPKMTTNVFTGESFINPDIQ